MKKQVLIAGAVATLGTAGLLGGAAYATTQSSDGTDPRGNLVSAIATKFNLKTADVQAVFDANKTQMDAQREQSVKDKVATLVKSGKLTQAQADKLNAKRAELEKAHQADRTAAQRLTQDQRKAKMDANRVAVDAWLKENGIDAQYGRLLMGGHGGHGDSHGRAKAPTSSGTTASTN
jgi:hypothetical protein